MYYFSFISLAFLLNGLNWQYERLGMMMLSPMLVSLPFKLLLFVLVDGWAMTVGSLVATYSAS